MSCCSIASGCGIPVTGCTGTSVAAGHVLVELSANQVPIYVDICKGDIYYWDGTKWLILGKDDKFLLYDTASRVLTLQPDGSSVQLPLASTTIAGLVKVDNGSAISITTDGTLVIDCAALKTQCNLLDKANIPTGNVIYYNTTTNMLDVDCAKLKVQCNLLDKSNAPADNVIYYNSTTNMLDVDCAELKQQCGLVDKTNVPAGNVIYYNSTTNVLDVDCNKLKQNCNLASATDLPVSGSVVKIDPTSKQLQVDCAALKTQCNLATVDQIPAIPTYNFGQQASLNGTVLHIANTQDPAAGVDVDLSSLVSSGGAGGGAENYLALYTISGNDKSAPAVGAQVLTKYGILQSIEIVEGKVWGGNSGGFVPASVRAVTNVLANNQPPTKALPLFPIGIGDSLDWKILVGGIILHYSEGSVTNSDVCGAPFGIKISGSASFL